MEDLKKVNSEQLYMLWKNFTMGCGSVIILLAFSSLLPYYLSPVVALVCSAVLYTLLYNNRISESPTCMVVPYATFYCMVSYTFVSIIINVLYAWGLVVVPDEIIFFNNPYIPAILYFPTASVTLLVMYFRRHRLMVCVDCKLHSGDSVERGRLGAILTHESHLQLRNILIIVFVLTLLVLVYYAMFFYRDTIVNSRDAYVFTWVPVLILMLDDLFFVARYYNLYLDLKENDEIITPEEISDMTAKTYIRYYVVCGNKVFVNTHSVDPSIPYREVIDTPFFTKRTVNGITVDEVRRIITKMTRRSDGELRFFYGRKSPDMYKHSLLRYFYFIDADGDSCPAMDVEGEWMDFELIKKIYTTNPSSLAQISCADISRLATIILTEKIFDENGMRKSKIKMYNPTFNLIDVRNSSLDFQDDKWIRISMFNSDTPMFRVKRWWRNAMGGSSRSSKNNRQWR